MSTTRQYQYDKDGLPVLSFLESASLTWIIIRMPFVLLWKAVASNFSKSAKPTNRVVFEASSRHVLGNASIQQLQRISGTSTAAYLAWAKQANQQPVIESLEGGTKLFWIGDKNADFVLLYCHGGGFVGPLCDFQCKFSEIVCTEFAKKSNGATLAVAALDYSLIPHTFPTQLLELSTAIQHILAQGTSPNHLFMAGESAGANMITQLLLHHLHPHPSLPAPTSLSAPIAGTLLFSPWCVLEPKGTSTHTNADKDLVTADTLSMWGRAYRAQLPDSQLPYVDSTAAPRETWYSGVQALTRRVLVTAGDDEVLRDDVLGLADMLSAAHEDVRVEVQPGGVHVDMVFDVAAKSKTLSPVTSMVVDWLVETAGGQKS